VKGGGELRPEDAALTDFALLVRNARPVPNHGEAAALDARVEAAREPQQSRRSRRWEPVLAGVFTVLLFGAVVAVAVKPGETGDMAATVPSSTAQSASGNVAKAAPRPDSTESFVQDTAARAGTKSLSEPISRAGGSADREVARTARLTLAADGGKIETISDRVNAMTDRFGGYVATSRVSAGEGNKGRASFVLMLPAAQYNDALAALSKLAHVRSRSQSSEDITADFKATERALKANQDRVAALEAKLAAAETPAARVAIRHNLERARFAMRQSARRARVNRQRVNYVPLELTIVADKTADTAGDGTITKAIDRAGKILTGAVAVLIVALAVLLPLALIGAASIFGYRRWRRASRDGAIAAATSAQPE
jgi:type IV secretory pathway VirB2 component (pilin)